jgi:hypothetical protein
LWRIKNTGEGVAKESKQGQAALRESGRCNGEERVAFLIPENKKPADAGFLFSGAAEVPYFALA